MITQEELKQLLDYNPETGIFTWRVRTSTCIRVGDVAGTLMSSGYIGIRINKRDYRAHRLAFLFMDGYFPENEVDHINRNRADNRWCNLREVGRQCNLRNAGQRKDNRSGIRGVYWNKRYDVWHAQISVNRKRHSLGYFADFTEAVAHRFAAEQCLDWLECDTASTAGAYLRGAK